MAISRATSLSRLSSSFSLSSLSRYSLLSLTTTIFKPKHHLFTTSSVFSITATAASDSRPCTSEDMTISNQSVAPVRDSKPRWKPICLYYTQGKCTKMDDATHLDIFNHSCSVELQVKATDTKNVPQKFDFFLVLDLEGKVEILEFPVLIINAKTMEVVDFFHRFVRPTEMTEQRINEYIEGKYGKIGVDRVWHDTAISFEEVVEQFEEWLTKHQLWEKESGGLLNGGAFVTCGNWDIKTKIPQQCKVAKMKLPGYFMEWINLKDVFLNFYQRRATGMMTMMKELQMPLLGSHHLGIDDTKNIARVLQQMLADGAVVQITARRNPKAPEDVEFLYKNRIR